MRRAELPDGTKQLGDKRLRRVAPPHGVPGEQRNWSDRKHPKTVALGHVEVRRDQGDGGGVCCHPIDDTVHRRAHREGRSRGIDGLGVLGQEAGELVSGFLGGHTQPVMPQHLGSGRWAVASGLRSSTSAAAGLNTASALDRPSGRFPARFATLPNAMSTSSRRRASRAARKFAAHADVDHHVGVLDGECPHHRLQRGQRSHTSTRSVAGRSARSVLTAWSAI